MLKSPHKKRRLSALAGLTSLIVLLAPTGAYANVDSLTHTAASSVSADTSEPPAVAGRQIYVRENRGQADGDGSQESPYTSFFRALEAAHDGDEILLLDNVSLGSDTNTPRGSIALTQSVTINGQGNELAFRGSPLELLGDITLKNLTLGITPDGSSEAYIFASDHTITFDAVTTKPASVLTPPTLVAGPNSGVEGGSGAHITFKNSRPIQGNAGTAFQRIVAGDIYKDKTLPTTIELDAFVSATNGVDLSGDNHQNTAATRVSSHSNNKISVYRAQNASHSSLAFSGRTPSTLTVSGTLDQLHLEGVNVRMADGFAGADTLTLAASDGETSSVTLSESDTPRTITFGAIDSNNGKITLPLNSALHIRGNVTGNLAVEVDNSSEDLDDYEDKTFVTVDGGLQDSTAVTLWRDSDEYTLAREGNSIVLRSAISTLPDVPIIARLSFDANEGTGTMEDIEAPVDSVHKLPANGFNREGYTFTGWNTEANGMGDTYQPEAEYTVTDNVTFYAQWAPQPQPPSNNDSSENHEGTPPAPENGAGTQPSGGSLADEDSTHTPGASEGTPEGSGSSEGAPEGPGSADTPGSSENENGSTGSAENDSSSDTGTPGGTASTENTGSAGTSTPGTTGDDSTHAIPENSAGMGTENSTDPADNASDALDSPGMQDTDSQADDGMSTSDTTYGPGAPQGAGNPVPQTTQQLAHTGVGFSFLAAAFMMTVIALGSTGIFLRRHMKR
ncbi:InlB B-repeat-containing protein [Schaalia sp. lx-260]|uniref:InlB B-repeat-containing protein n=1 Tax=Schaalia sp. lx-260 TaxID=2899082 RepID=UPI001E44ADE3|nr:InlB B-repeat-containing protein [Schaalia sp. lx-260]MCD4548976.1 InlB B-repeat-containing protein [Schaalia sp. lx-260]